MQMNLFSDAPTEGRHTIRLKSISAVFRTEKVAEDMPEWVTTRFTSPEQVAAMFHHLKDEAKEHFVVLHLDGKNRIMCFDRVSTGSLNQSIVHPREVYKSACLSSAAAILLLHNHPTGDTTPSQEDIAITRELREAGELLGIKVLDHIIIGDGFTSFVQRGLL